MEWMVIVMNGMGDAFANLDTITMAMDAKVCLIIHF